MQDKFYSPYLIWSAIWLFICFIVLLISVQNHELSQQSSRAKESLFHASRPYGVFSRQYGFCPGPLERPHLSSIPRPAFPPSGDGYPPLPFLKPDTGGGPEREFSFFPQSPPSSWEALENQYHWRQVWESAARASYLFNVLSYIFFAVGFGAICLITAIYQNHFRRAQEEQFETEIEARNLRIQVLESSRDALDLKLQLLDREYAGARSAAQEAQENIRDLEEKLQSEAERNEELQGELKKALLEENQALALLRSLDRDRQKIAAEQTDVASRLAEAENETEADFYRQKIRKAKGRLRLNSLWLTALYKNLAFSPRALQNIQEIQDVPEVFPSLPDALARINNTTLEALQSGEKLPPKTVARFTTQELEHFQGHFWEYRFSADGRIFFGVSQSRTWNIDTILLKRRFPDKKEKYDRYLAAILGKDNRDLQP